ncbi:TIGR02679 family protein [Allosaccharopolyspora coralli]|uniref:TIGR02679 family protein n=2 Tax=Allosaccharopolyspora coralli TaxID=2665642 RepID=A0A5Q3QLM2_9PSEU|nr:TIGR02679 family protein [Allosaccharopolyspora coralli]
MELGKPLTTSVTLSEANSAQREAVHRLLGRRPRAGTTLTVSLPAVDDVLRQSGACPDGLEVAVTTLTGPVTVRSEAAEREERGWREAFAPLRDAVHGRAELADWYDHLHSSGLVRRLTGTFEQAAPVLHNLAAVVRALPTSAEPLGHFAARITGSAHALDDNRPLSTLTLGAARAVAGLPDGSGAQWQREVWAAVGILRDELSSTVLTLGLPGDARTATGRALEALRGAGQPAVLTLRQLIHDTPEWTIEGQPVSICENPVVVAAAADRLGSMSAPLVCANGQPGAAVMHLLRQLATSAARLRYHGDFDWGGLRIGNVVFDRLPVIPWRFDSAAYEAAVTGHSSHQLGDKPVHPSWDDRLGARMQQVGLAVEEEHVVDDLIDDLSLSEQHTDP